VDPSVPKAERKQLPLKVAEALVLTKFHAALIESVRDSDGWIPSATITRMISIASPSRSENEHRPHRPEDFFLHCGGFQQDILHEGER
jgi:hypothetical protein